jgi:type III restriction enzyme
MIAGTAGKSSRTGFKAFTLSEENLARLLKGERPQGEKFDLASRDFSPKLIDRPFDTGLLPLRRLGCKMATGSGKTVVMAMLIAWAFCNRGVNPASTEFPNAVLVCCPNLTVKERLQVLRPDDPDNYYAAFDLVPVNLRPHLQMGKVLVTNWHLFAPESEHKEGGQTFRVVNKGPETPDAFARRVLGDLYDRLPVLVLNDEGHHCWRPAPQPADAGANDGQPKARGRRRAADEPTAEERAALEAEAAEARVWLEVLDRLNNCRGPASRPSRCAWTCQRPLSTSAAAATRRANPSPGW